MIVISRWLLSVQVLVTCDLLLSFLFDCVLFQFLCLPDEYELQFLICDCDFPVRLLSLQILVAT